MELKQDEHGRVSLDPAAEYLAPTGRLCRYVPLREGGFTTYATLLYHCNGKPAETMSAEGFTLAPANWYLLRKVR